MDIGTVNMFKHWLSGVVWCLESQDFMVECSNLAEHESVLMWEAGAASVLLFQATKAALVGAWEHGFKSRGSG